MIKKNKMIFLILLTSLSTFSQTKCIDFTNLASLMIVGTSSFIAEKTLNFYFPTRKMSEKKLNKIFDDLCFFHEKKEDLSNKKNLINSIIMDDTEKSFSLSHKSITPPKSIKRIFSYLNKVMQIKNKTQPTSDTFQKKKNFFLKIQLEKTIKEQKEILEKTEKENKKNNLKIKNVSQKAKQTFDSLYKNEKSKKEKSHELLKRCMNQSFDSGDCLMAVLDVVPDFLSNESNIKNKVKKA